MASVLSDNFLSGPAMGQERAEIPLRTAGHKETGVEAKKLGGSFLKASNCGVFTKDVITDFGGRHGLSHAGRWDR